MSDASAAPPSAGDAAPPAPVSRAARLLRGRRGIPATSADASLGFLGHDLSIAFLGHLLSKGTGIVTFVLITRALGPAEYAIFALADAVFQIALQLSELGLETGVTRFVAKGIRGRDAAATARVLNAVFAAKLVTGLGVFLLGWFGSPLIAAHILARPEMTRYLRIALIGLFGMHFSGFYQAYFSARLEFARNAVFNLLTPSVILAAMIVAHFSGHLDVLTALKIYAVAPALVCLVAVAVLPHDFLGPVPTIADIKPVWRFSRWIYVTNTLGEVRFRMSAILLSRLATSTELGLYGFGDKLAATLTLFTNTILTVFLPRASHLVTHDEVKELLRRSYRWTLLLLPPLLVVPLVARPLIRILAPAYVDAAPLFVVLFVSILFSLAALPSRTVLYSANRPQVETWVEGGAVLFTLVAGYALVRAHGPLGAAVTMLLQRLLSSAVLMGFVYVRIYRGAREHVETAHLTGITPG